VANLPLAIRNWDDLLALLGPGTASGTFDYFTVAILGTQSRSRKDYAASEDDAVLVDGVAKDVNALRTSGTRTTPLTEAN
jgi:phosphate transport system substrate-binding protein